MINTMSQPKTSGPRNRVAVHESACHDADRDDAEERGYLEDTDFEDRMDPEERAALDAALAEGWAELRAGKGIPADEVLRELRKR